MKRMRGKTLFCLDLFPLWRWEEMTIAVKSRDGGPTGDLVCSLRRVALALDSTRTVSQLSAASALCKHVGVCLSGARWDARDESKREPRACRAQRSSCMRPPGWQAPSPSQSRSFINLLHLIEGPLALLDSSFAAPATSIGARKGKHRRGHCALSRPRCPSAPRARLLRRSSIPKSHVVASTLHSQT